MTLHGDGRYMNLDYKTTSYNPTVAVSCMAALCQRNNVITQDCTMQ
jgi:hypothetical protein